MPIHPFHGQRLEVVRYGKDQRGNRLVYVHHPKAGFLRLPIEWTDRSIAVPSLAKVELLRINATGLLNLARACAVALSGIDEKQFSMNPAAQFNGQSKDPETVDTNDLAKSFGKSETKSSRSVGNADAQNYPDAEQGDGQ